MEVVSWEGKILPLEKQWRELEELEYSLEQRQYSVEGGQSQTIGYGSTLQSLGI